MWSAEQWHHMGAGLVGQRAALLGSERDSRVVTPTSLTPASSPKPRGFAKSSSSASFQLSHPGGGGRVLLLLGTVTLK